MSKIIKIKKDGIEANPIGDKWSIESNGAMVIKFAGGTMIYIHNFTLPEVQHDSGTDTTVNLAVPFLNSNYAISIQLISNPAYWSWAATHIFNRTSSSFSVGVWNNAHEGSIAATRWDFILIGRWK